MVLKETFSHWVESTEFYIWSSGVSNLEMLTIAESFSREEEELDGIPTSHRGGNWELVLPFSQLVLQQSLAVGFCSRRHRAEIQIKEVLIITLQSGPSHAYILLVAFKHLRTAQWIRASPSQGSMKGNNRMSVQNQRLYLHQQCPIKALTCIQAIQKPQPSISSQQLCSPGRVMHPKFHLLLLISFREEKKPANGINFLMESS